VIVGSSLAVLNYLVMAYIDVFKPKMLNTESDPDNPLTEFDNTQA
jgi:hypothetical protein